MTPVKIDKLIPGGQALGTLDDGRKIMLWGAITDEIVDYEITRAKRSYVEGIATKILTPSPHRVTPRDDCYLATSPWQIMDYQYELDQKSSLIREVFRQQGITIGSPDIITDGHDFHYRNKMEYSLYWDNSNQQIYPAFHIRGTHRKIPIHSSSIERPEIRTEVERIISQLNSTHASARDYQSIVVRANQQGEVSSGLLHKNQPHPKMKLLTDTILDHQYSYSPNGFFQVNLPVYELALKHLQPFIQTDKVVDLYAGVGTIGLSTARDRDLTLVESDARAFAELEKNCSLVQATNHIHPILAKAETALDYIQPDATIIIDPPRAGCDFTLISRLITVRPAQIVYLSCNPITQARDIAPLLEHYQITSLTAFNFFPRTPHIENLVILTRH